MVVQSRRVPAPTATSARCAGTNLNVYSGYTALPQSGSNASTVYAATASTTLTASESVYALKVTGALRSAEAFTLTVGGGSGPAGLILNSGARIGTTTLAFGGGEGVIYSGGTASNTSPPPSPAAAG